MFLAATVLRKTRRSPWQQDSGSNANLALGHSAPNQQRELPALPARASHSWRSMSCKRGGAKVEFSILPGKVLSSTGNGRWALTAGLCSQRRNTCTKADHQTWLTPHTRVRHAHLWWVASAPKVAASAISSATRHLTQQPSDSKCSQPAGEQMPLPTSSAGPLMSNHPTLWRREYPQAFFRFLLKAPGHTLQHFLKDFLDHIKQRCNFFVRICFLL